MLFNMFVIAVCWRYQAVFAQMVGGGAEQNCPVSKVLNVPIAVDAKLIAT